MMQSVNSGMSKRVLTDILATDYGIQAPSNSNKKVILTLLEEAGCPVTPDETQNNDIDKQPQYVVNIFKQKGEGDVLGGINGKAFQLPRGKDITISAAVYEILTKGAVKNIGDPLDGGGVEFHKEQAYPLTLVEVIK